MENNVSDEITIELLKKISIFDGLEDSDITKLAQIVQKGTIPADTEFFKEGDAGDAFYILINGEVEVFKSINSKRILLNTITSNDTNNFFGEMALIEDLPRNATIISKTECEILQIEKKDFDILIKLNSFVALRIMTALTKRLRANPPTTFAQENAKEAEKELQANIISLFSPKGGSGKTSLAVNMANGISKYLEKKVLLIDLDFQFGNIAFLLGLKVKKTIADLTEANALKSFDDLKTCLVKHNSGFDLLPAPLKPEQSENIDSNLVRKIISLCKKHYDYIFIDCHSLLQDISINALDLSDQILIVMNPDMSHIVSVHSCLKLMESLNYPKEKINLILNKYDVKLSKPKEDIDEALQKVEKKISYIIHEDKQTALDLINNCMPVFETKNVTDYRNDIVALINGVTKEKLPPKAGKSGGIFGAFINWLNS